VKQILYTKKQKYYHSEIKRKGSLKDFMYIAHCSFRLQVLKQVRCRQSYVYCTLQLPFTSPETGKMQAILCPEELWCVSVRT